jgi:hypothetical protein
VKAPPKGPSEATQRSMTMLEQLESSYHLLATQPGEAAAAAEGGHVDPPQNSPCPDDRPEPSLDSEAADCADVTTEGGDFLQSPGSTTPQSPGPTSADSGGGTDRDAERRRSHSLASAQRKDVAAVGALIVQLYTRRMHHVRSTDMKYWRSQIRHLPSAARSIASACLGADGAPSTGQLLQDELFTGSVRAAAEFLGIIQPSLTAGDRGSGSFRSRQRRQLGNDISSISRLGVARWSPCVHQLLADLVDSGGVCELHKTPGVLHICLPAIIQLLEAAALLPAEQSAPASSAAQNLPDNLHTAAKVASNFVTVLQQLLQCLTRQEVQQECVLLWQRTLSGRPQSPHSHSGRSNACTVSSQIQAALLQIDVLKELLVSVGLSTFVDSVHPRILDIVCCSAHTVQSARHPHSLVTQASQVALLYPA